VKGNREMVFPVNDFLLPPEKSMDVLIEEVTLLKTDKNLRESFAVRE